MAVCRDTIFGVEGREIAEGISGRPVPQRPALSSIKLPFGRHARLKGPSWSSAGQVFGDISKT